MSSKHEKSMDKKSCLTLARVLKVDHRTIESIERLYCSRFPDRFIPIIINAKSHWLAMRAVHGPAQKGIKYFENIEVKFLLEADKSEELYAALRPLLSSAIGKARGRKFPEKLDPFNWNNSFLVIGSRYAQHNYWWKF